MCGSVRTSQLLSLSLRPAHILAWPKPRRRIHSRMTTMAMRRRRKSRPNTRPLRTGKFVVNKQRRINRKVAFINRNSELERTYVPKICLNCGDFDVSMAMDVPYFRCGGMPVVKMIKGIITLRRVVTRRVAIVKPWHLRKERIWQKRRKRQ